MSLYLIEVYEAELAAYEGGQPEPVPGRRKMLRDTIDELRRIWRSKCRRCGQPAHNGRGWCRPCAQGVAMASGFAVEVKKDDGHG